MNTELLIAIYLIFLSSIQFIAFLCKTSEVTKVIGLTIRWVSFVVGICYLLKH